MKIAFYAPVKNEERMIEEFVNYHLKEMKKGDIFVFADTGSTDSTVAKIRHMQEDGKPVLLFEDYPQDHPLDFSFLRNFALGKVPEDIDIGVALDIDEMFVKEGWRDLIESKFADGVKKVLVHRRWEDLSEESGVQGKHFIHQRSSIHSIDSKVNWIYPVHECLSFDESIRTLTCNDIITAHLRNTKKERPSYRKLIEDYIAAKPKLKKADKMHVQYIYANELYCAKSKDEAVKQYRKYLKMTEDFSVDIMSEAYRNNIANACVKLAGMFAEKKDAMREGEYKAMAFAAKPCRETALLLSVWFATRNEYEAAMKLFELGSSYVDKTKSYNVLDIFWEKDRLERIKSLIQAGLDSQEKKTESQEKHVEESSEKQEEEKPKRQKRTRKGKEQA